MAKILPERIVITSTHRCVQRIILQGTLEENMETVEDGMLQQGGRRGTHNEPTPPHLIAPDIR